MRLTLTGDCPWKSQYLNDAGQVVYDVSFPYALIDRTATIRKVVELGTLLTPQLHSCRLIHFLHRLNHLPDLRYSRIP